MEGGRGANQLLVMNQEVSHGVAEGNSPRRQPWEPGEKAISPGRGGRIPLSRRTFFRRYAARNLQHSTPRLTPWATLCRCSAAIWAARQSLSQNNFSSEGRVTRVPIFRGIYESGARITRPSDIFEKLVSGGVAAPALPDVEPCSGNKNGAGFWPAPLSPAPPERVLHVVIHPAFALRASARQRGFIVIYTS